MQKIRVYLKICFLFLCWPVAVLLGYHKKPAVLMYHSFDETNWKHGVSPRELKRQITYLQTYKQIVPLSEVVAYAKSEKGLASNVVAITVDDGYLDTYTILFSLAKKHSFPFTVFLTTDLTPQEKLGNIARPSWEQVKEMYDSGLVQFEVHGHSHINFPDLLDQGLEEREITASRELIKQKLGYTSQLVAYPAGRCSPAVIAYIKQLGFEAAFLATQGVIRSGDNRFGLKRVPVDRATSFALFKLRLLPGFILFLKLKRCFQ